MLRQGETVIMDLCQPDAEPFVQDLTNRNFVTAHFYNNEVLILKECRKFKLFKIGKYHETDYTEIGRIKGQIRFQGFHTIDISGFISLTPG